VVGQGLGHDFSGELVHMKESTRGFGFLLRDLGAWAEILLDDQHLYTVPHCGLNVSTPSSLATVRICICSLLSSCLGRQRYTAEIASAGAAPVHR